jgi:predicted RNase H-like HicB family nuclease
MWRATVPAIPGCFVDASTIQGAIADIQECAAMMLDIYEQEARPLPTAAVARTADHFEAKLPVIIAEHSFRRTVRRKSAPVVNPR